MCKSRGSACAHLVGDQICFFSPSSLDNNKKKAPRPPRVIWVPSEIESYLVGFGVWFCVGSNGRTVRDGGDISEKTLSGESFRENPADETHL